MDTAVAPSNVDADDRPPLRTRGHAAIAAALALAAAVRLLPFTAVFTPAGIRFLADGDPYYHVLRAREIAIRHRVVWNDPGLNYPFGADVPWPPLFDAMIAAPAWVAGWGAPQPATVDTIAAFVPVVIGVVLVLVTSLLARELAGTAAGVVAAFLSALLPASVEYGLVGRPDQHVLEALLLTTMVLVYARALRSDGDDTRWKASGLLGVLICAAFWNWLGSSFTVGILCALVAVAHVFGAGGRAAVRTVGIACAVAAALYASTVLAFGPPGALGRIALGGISAFPVVVTGGAAAWCGLLALASRGRASTSAGRRTVEVVVAAIAVATFLLAAGLVEDAVIRGWTAASRANSWYKSIREFRPLLFQSYVTYREQIRAALMIFGLLPALAAFGTPGVVSSWRREPSRRPALAILATFGICLALLSAYMLRFGYYAAAPLAVFAAIGVLRVRDAVARLGRRASLAVATGAALVAVAPGIAVALPRAWAAPKCEMLARIFEPFRTGRMPREGAVLARWDWGHHIRFFAGLPIVASPFGTEGGAGAMEDLATFFLADDEAAAHRLLTRRGVRWVLVEDPATTVADSLARSERKPPPITIVRDPLRGFIFHCEEPYDRLVPVRLYYDAGASTAKNPSALGGFRLVADIGPPGGPPVMRLFEVVAGATIQVLGAHPGGTVVASTSIATQLGTFVWTARTTARDNGEALVTLPYATGPNGGAIAAPFTFTDGNAFGTLVTTEEQIKLGARIRLDLSGRGDLTRTPSHRRPVEILEGAIGRDD